jgi:hypothetical protein
MSDNQAAANQAVNQVFSQVFFPKNIADLFAAWGRFPEGRLFAGGGSFLREQSTSGLELPQNIISLEKLEELDRIGRTERYLDIGAMASFSRLLELGKIVPEALRKALLDIRSPQARNLITLGGAVCNGNARPLHAVMLAMDAQYEFRAAAAPPRWISAARFSQVEGGVAVVGSHELLTRIRIPLDEWDYSLCKNFPPAFSAPQNGRAGCSRAFAVFLARIQKNILSALRVVIQVATDDGAGRSANEAQGRLYRDKNSELFLTGKKLPLAQKDAAHFSALWRDYLAAAATAPSPFMARNLEAFIAAAVSDLAE